MKWDIVHQTRFTYAKPVKHSFNEARLQPFSNAEQTVESFELNVLPAARLSQYHDLYSNLVHHFEIVEPHSSLLVESKVRVTTRPAPPIAENLAPFPLTSIDDAIHATRPCQFTEPRRYTEISPEPWRRAGDDAPAPEGI